MKTTPFVPFLDLITPHCSLEDELLNVVRSSIHTGCFVGGPILTDFENAFAEFCQTPFCVGVASGTDALRFAIMAAGISPGQVVITVPNTFIATTEAISQAGAIPEFVDVDESTCNMDPSKLRDYLENKCTLHESTGKLISRRSRRQVAGIIPVHLYGQMADMDPIIELAERYDLVVIEDACQAHGAEYFSAKQNRRFRAGSMGKAAAFSFYPGKNLGACGEAGAMTTNDEKIANFSRQLRDHGQTAKYFHSMEGYNGRLDAIQAGFLLAKLPHLTEWNESRRERAAEYHALFQSVGAPVQLLREPAWSRGVYHLYVVRTQERDQFITWLKDNGIGSGIHYPVPLHLQEAYRHLGYAEGDFPISERLAREIVSLPMFPQLQPSQQWRIVSAICQFAEKRTALTSH
jgi:dTDP-4-amino-4,6-dideoxygalactose transaminase